MLKDLFIIYNVCVRNFVKWYNILYFQFVFYFKNKELEYRHCIQLFEIYIRVYWLEAIINYFKKFLKKFKWKRKKKKGSLFSNLQFWYHKKKRLLKESFNKNIKRPLLLLNYSINNGVEYVFFVLFKTGANSIIYYFYKSIKFLYSICVYIWKSDVIYRFLKFFERKKW